MKGRSRGGTATLIAVLITLFALPFTQAGASVQPTTVQILSVSDWHGQLDPITVSGVGSVGGAAVLSSYFKADRAKEPNTLTLTAGDAFNASPTLSSVFEEEPAVRAMNMMGFTADTIGNHNFDRGTTHLRRMIELAEFPYVSANLHDPDQLLGDVSPWTMVETGGIKVGIVGVTNPEAPSLVSAGRMGTVQVGDPAPAANRARAEAQAAGAQITVAITHMGVTSVDPVTGAAFGPLVDFANNVGGFDLILGDHTDVKWSGIIGRSLVVENRSKGLTYARVKLVVDKVSGRVLNRNAEFVTPVKAAVTEDPAIVNMLQPYRDSLAAKFDEVIGTATGLFPRSANIERLQEVAIGDLVADAMRQRYGTQLAIVNGGALRQPLPSTYLPADKTLRRNSSGYAAGPPYDLVAGDVLSVLPFGNIAITRSLTGQQLWSVLEHSVSSIPAANGRFLQISGFRFAYDSTRAVGTRVTSVSLADGTVVPRDATTYSIVLPDFVNGGGDGYTMIADGSGVTRDVLMDIVLEHIRGAGSVTPYTDGRIARLA